MKLLTASMLTFRNALIVSFAVFLIFGVFELLKLPFWGLGFGLIPVGYLYYKLAKEKAPRLWKMVGFMTMITVFNYVCTEFLPRDNVVYRTILFGVALWLMFTGSHWLEKRFKGFASSDDPLSSSRFRRLTTLRKQYHLRPSESGLLAWDVNRLIEQSKELQLPIIEVSLSSIDELDEPFWFQDAEIPTCRAVAEHGRLIETADLAFPIILSANGRVMDGMHRVAKALMQGQSTIHAVRFVTGPAPDFVGVNPRDLPY